MAWDDWLLVDNAVGEVGPGPGGPGAGQRGRRMNGGVGLEDPGRRRFTRPPPPTGRKKARGWTGGRGVPVPSEKSSREAAHPRAIGVVPSGTQPRKEERATRSMKTRHMEN